MVDRIAERILAILNYVPELFVAKDDPRFDFIRWRFAFIIIVLVVYAIAMLRKAFRT